MTSGPGHPEAPPTRLNVNQMRVVLLLMSAHGQQGANKTQEQDLN